MKPTELVPSSSLAGTRALSFELDPGGGVEAGKVGALGTENMRTHKHTLLPHTFF